MPRGSTQSRNHPPKGATLKVEPIRDLEAISEIKRYLSGEGNWRDYCLFTLGINTAFRASDLLSLTVGQVENLEPGDLLEIKEKKTRKYRAVTVNKTAYYALRVWLNAHPARSDPDAPLFLSQRRRAALCVSSVNRLVKKWCRYGGLHGQFGSHTMRKTWGYQQRKANDASLPLLMSAFGHRTEAQTLEYLYIQPRELRDLFFGLEL
ncbi:tyrosine-type recombinase/integrase [Candidatus Thiodiazotropha sp. CDECU1]|uniref:tyrosine-type recombinase/integrase n=1 Tax=Candidatus Thiodiazotropha sp. CDECU1 TaxID=3065865 RepID=UPI00292D69FF|nr:tyrosine-type recombinase/integrase [Candidatus Thiodiazotropha sp. CDECU1]